MPEELKDFHVPMSQCPSCSRAMNGAMATEAGVQEVSPGDVTVCAYCGEFAMYREDLQLELLREGAAALIRQEYPEDWVKMCRLQRMLREKGGPGPEPGRHVQVPPKRGWN